MKIRPFSREDIPRVAELHQKVFGVNGVQSTEPVTKERMSSYDEFFRGVFLENPWQQDGITSLVAADETSGIKGFLGVFPRRMKLRDRIITVAISSQFIVDPENRNPGIGMGLMKTFLAGPQDLSLTDEANDISRKLWEKFGGETALLHSFHWTRALRPSKHVISQFTGVLGLGKPLTTIVLASTGFACGLIDSYLAKRFPHRFGHSLPNVIGEEMTPEQLFECFQNFSPPRALWPDYDADSLRWLLSTIRGKQKPENLRVTAVRSAGRALSGWYVYQVMPDGTCQLLQMMARKASINDVFDHALHQAWSQGANALSGRLDPQFIQALADRRCSFQCGTPWLLLHSRDSELIRSIQEGDSLLSKLEGEWCLHFKG